MPKTYFSKSFSNEIVKNPEYLKDKIHVFSPRNDWKIEDIENLKSLLSESINCIAFIDFRLVTSSNVGWYSYLLNELQELYELYEDSPYLYAASKSADDFRGGYYFAHFFDAGISNKQELVAKLLCPITHINLSTYLSDPSLEYCIVQNNKTLRDRDHIEEIVINTLYHWMRFEINTNLDLIWKRTSRWFKNSNTMPPHVCPDDDNIAEKCLDSFYHVFGIARLPLPENSDSQSFNIYRKIHEPLKHMCGAYYGGSSVVPGSHYNLKIGSVFILLLMAFHDNQMSEFITDGLQNWMNLNLELPFLDSVDRHDPLGSMNCQNAAKHIYEFLTNLVDSSPRSDGKVSGVESITFPDNTAIQINLKWNIEILLSTNCRHGSTWSSMNSLRNHLNEGEFSSRFILSSNSVKIVAMND
jgi:hypothetical protein